MKKALCSLLFCATALRADPMTLEQALRVAEENNPDLQATVEALIAADEREGVAWRELLPSLDVELYGKEGLGDSTNTYSAALVVSQSIYKGGRLWRGYRLAQKEAKSSQLSVDRQKQILRAGVRRAWYQLLLAKELQQESKEALERLKKLAKHARHFFDEGMVWRSDVLEADVNVARGERDLVASDKRLVLSQARLNQLLHQQLSHPIETEEPLKEEDHLWSLQDALKTAATERSDLKKQRVEVEKQHDRVHIAQAGHLPSLDLAVEWNTSADNIRFRHLADGKHVAVTASVNLFQWGKTSKAIAAARADKRATEQRMASLKDQVDFEVRQAWLALTEAESSVALLRDALELGQENYRVNTVRYEEQQGTARDVIEAQDLLTRTRTEYLNAVSDYLTALADLELAVGI